MIYSERWHKYYQGFVYLAAIVLAGLAFLVHNLHNNEPHVICIMNEGMWFDIFVTGPLILFILMNLYVNFYYGQDAYLKTFSKNYKRFKMIFFCQRIYFVIWVITMIPVFLYGYADKQLFVNIYAVSLAFQPIGIVLTFLVSWYYLKNLYKERLREKGCLSNQIEKQGMTQKTIEEIDNDMNFKETISKEIVNKISSSLDVIYKNAPRTALIGDQRTFEKRDLDDEEKGMPDDFGEEVFFDSDDDDGPAKAKDKGRSMSNKGTANFERKTTETAEKRGLLAKMKGCVDFIFDRSEVKERTDSTYNTYGNQRIMKKVDLKSHYQISKSADSKKTYNITLKGEDTVY